MNSLRTLPVFQGTLKNGVGLVWGKAARIAEKNKPFTIFVIYVKQ